jgi:hypothetical protein
MELAPNATSATDDAARPATKDEAPASPAQATDAAHHAIAADAREGVRLSV